MTVNDLTLSSEALFLIQTGSTLNVNGHLTIGDHAVFTNKGSLVVEGDIYRY